MRGSMVAAAGGLTGVKDRHQDGAFPETAQDKPQQQDAQRADDCVDRDVKAVLIDVPFRFADDPLPDEVIREADRDVLHGCSPPFWMLPVHFQDREGRC